MNHDIRFIRAVGRMPRQAKWPSIEESELKALKARSELLDELAPLVNALLDSDVYSDAEGLVNIRTAGYDDDSYQETVSLIEDILSKAKELNNGQTP